MVGCYFQPTLTVARSLPQDFHEQKEEAELPHLGHFIRIGYFLEVSMLSA